MNTWTFIYKYIKKYKWPYIAGMATLFIVDFASLYIPRLTGMITDGLSSGNFGMGDVDRCLLCILGLGLIMTIGRVGWRFFLIGTSRNVERDIRNDMFTHLTLMSTRFYQKMGSGDLMSRFTNDLSCIRQAIGPAVISLFDGTVMTVMVLCQMVFYVDYRLTLLTMLPMVLIAFGVVFYGRLMHKLYEDRQVAISSLTDYSRESFTGIRVIKSFVREKHRMYEFARENANTREKTLKANYQMALMMPLLDLVIEISILITLVYGGYLTIKGTVSLGKFVAYNQYIIMLIWPMIACGDAVNSFSQGAASIGRIREIMETEPEIRDSDDCGSYTDTGRYDIEFKNLNFGYPDRSDAGVWDISFKLEQGRCLAIAGRTGCGKTTIAELLLHVYQVQNGKIFIGGTDINSIPLHRLREMIAYVPQDDFLFSDTIRNNIAFGCGDRQKSISVAGDGGDRIRQVARASCIDESIMQFPAGYETWVGERGVTLSGGQKQRVCIARALLKNAPILILDDALSAVDTDTERQLIRNIMDVRAGMTTIIIAHRITTLQYADEVIVLENGHITEWGEQEEVLAKDGPYRDMYLRQQLEDEYRDML